MGNHIDQPPPLTNDLVSCETLARHLDDPEWRVIDARFDLFDTAAGENAYRESHIPGALYAHLDRDLAGPPGADRGRHPLPDPVSWQATVSRWGIGPRTRVVVYDDAGGAIAARLWWMLRWSGHARVALLDGGWNCWRSGGRALEAGIRRVESVDFRASIQTGWTADTNETALALAAGGLVLDARAAPRYRGEVEPIDSKPGHIPGAVNVPFSDNLDGHGRFRPSGQLRELYRDKFDGRHAAAAIAMCGSGVTACHSLLAMRLAGLGDGRLYVGSWSAWISDPERPIALGNAPQLYK